MGRIAGVTAAETRERLLASAASAFASKGYDGASMAKIAADAGVTSGAIYAHFPSKAELFVAALRSHCSGEVQRLFTLGSLTTDMVGVIRDRGIGLVRRQPEEASLLIEAIVAAKRHGEVTDLLVSSFTEREENLTALLETGQQAGVVDAGVRTAAVARFLVMLSLGSILVAAMDLPAVDEDDWAVLIGDLVGSLNRHAT